DLGHVRRGARRGNGRSAGGYADTWDRLLLGGAFIRDRRQRGAVARDSLDAAGGGSHPLLSDPLPLLSVSAGPLSALGRSARRGAAVGAVRFFQRGGADLLDAAASHPARGRLCARQRQPMAVAALSLDVVRFAGAGGAGAGGFVVLVDAPDRRRPPRAIDLRPLLPGAIRTGAGRFAAGDGASVGLARRDLDRAGGTGRPNRFGLRR